MAAKKDPSCSDFVSKLMGGVSLIPGSYVAWTGTAPTWARIWIGTGVGLWLLFTILLGLIKSAEL